MVMRLLRTNDNRCHYGCSEQFRFYQQKESLGAIFLDFRKALGLQWYCNFEKKCLFCEFLYQAEDQHLACRAKDWGLILTIWGSCVSITQYGKSLSTDICLGHLGHSSRCEQSCYLRGAFTAICFCEIAGTLGFKMRQAALQF